MLEWLVVNEGFMLYGTIFLCLMGGAIGLPIPEDIPLLAAGIVTQLGNANVEVMFVVCYSAILLGDILIFTAGRKFGPALFSSSWFQLKVPPARLRRLRVNLERRSLPMIFVARHLFYLRTVTFLACGAVKMRYRRFLLADATAALVSVPIMMGIGYFAAEQYDEIAHELRSLFLTLVIVLIASYAIYRWRKKRRCATNVDSEISDRSKDDT